MDEYAIIERTLAAALEPHLVEQARFQNRRIARLEAEVEALRRQLSRRRQAAIPPVRRTAKFERQP